MPRGVPITQEAATEMKRLHKIGHSLTAIAQTFGVHPSSVARYVNHPFPVNTSTSRRSASTHRTSAEEKQESFDERPMRHAATETTASGGAGIGKGVSTNMVSVGVQAGGFGSTQTGTGTHKGEMPPHLHEDRIAFCKEMQAGPIDDIVFCDDKTFLITRTGKLFVQYLPSEMPHVRRTQEEYMKVNVWIGITSKGEKMVHLTEGSLDSEKYVDILSQHFPQKGMRLLHNHTAYHRSRLTTQWLEENGVKTIDSIPIHSTDLNPAETLWLPVVEMVRSRHPKTVKQLWDAVSKAVEAVLTPDVIRTHVREYVDSLQECIDNGGMHVQRH